MSIRKNVANVKLCYDKKLNQNSVRRFLYSLSLVRLITALKKWNEHLKFA